METELGIAFKTGIGSGKLYEDRYRILDARVPAVREADRGFIYGVMDGVGGAPKGMAAAQLLAQRLIHFFKPENADPTANAIERLLKKANEDIAGWGSIPGTDRPRGAAALTVAWFSPDRRVHLFHAGDTTAYRFDGSNLVPLTAEQGTGRTLNNYAGLGDRFRVQRIGLEVDEGDTLVIVTDGVTKVCSPGQLEAVLLESPSVEVAAQRMVDLSRLLGSRDDITALVAELVEW